MYDKCFYALYFIIIITWVQLQFFYAFFVIINFIFYYHYKEGFLLYYDILVVIVIIFIMKHLELHTENKLGYTNKLYNNYYCYGFEDAKGH